MSEPPVNFVRLNKAIADSGYCARRKADVLIAGGHVQVNGEVVTELGTRVDLRHDVITIGGNPLPQIDKCYLAFHKPIGIVTSRYAGKEQRSIYTLIPSEYRSVDPAGRLDQDSSGLIILSNDGDFLFQITHPSFHLPKVYELTLYRSLSAEELQQLKDGVHFEPENKLAKMVDITLKEGTTRTYQVTLVTGLNRQIRRMVDALNNKVITLKRLSFGPVSLSNLEEGAVRHLSLSELNKLRELAASAPPKERQNRSQKKDGHVKHSRQQPRQQ